MHIFYCLNSLIKTQSSAENIVLLLFTLIALTNVTNYDRATAESNAILVTEIFCHRYSTINNFVKK